MSTPADGVTGRYLGIDLAWSEESGSGVCVLDASGTILDEGQLPPGALVEWVRTWRGERSVVGIDAPLVVPAGSGVCRPVERELHRRYGRFHAGPFPGGAASTAMLGRDVAPAYRLVDTVGSYALDPGDRSAAHRAIEVFPAPTWIELFNLPERIVYKRGRLSDRTQALGRLQDLLAGLDGAVPALRPRAVSQLTEHVLAAHTARQWKAVEDIIDARLCAYVAQLWDVRGEDDWVVVGDGTWQTGYVIVPPRRPIRRESLRHPAPSSSVNVP